MSNESVLHWFLTVGVGAFAFVLWNMFTEAKGKISALEKQNENQEREIASLKANHEGHKTTLDDVKQTVVRLEGKLDAALSYPIRDRRRTK